MDPIKTEIVVVGAGPGGYAAAFYAADNGKKVILVEREKRLGGVCLNGGSVPSKALEVEEIPERLLVVGGGYIGMELGTVYAALGAKVVVVEALDSILAGADADLVRPVMRYAEQHFHEVRLKTKVAKMATAGKQIKVVMQNSEGKEMEEQYDRVLVSVGRVPNCDDLGLENTKVERDDKGFLKVNPQQQTSDPNIYAIGDIAGGILLAHKASKEARIAVEVITGEASTFENVVIPAVVFTEPEVAW